MLPLRKLIIFLSLSQSERSSSSSFNSSSLHRICRQKNKKKILFNRSKNGITTLVPSSMIRNLGAYCVVFDSDIKVKYASAGSIFSGPNGDIYMTNMLYVICLILIDVVNKRMTNWLQREPVSNKNTRLNAGLFFCLTAYFVRG